LSRSLSSRQSRSMQLMTNRGASVFHHEQFYHAGLVKSGLSARVGSREEW
jgi:hypothetical protein